MPDAIATASPERGAEIAQPLVARVEYAMTDAMSGLVDAAGRAFFCGVLLERAVWDSNPRHED
jgi:hypothetical protein